MLDKRLFLSIGKDIVSYPYIPYSFINTPHYVAVLLIEGLRAYAPNQARYILDFCQFDDWNDYKHIRKIARKIGEDQLFEFCDKFSRQGLKYLCALSKEDAQIIFCAALDCMFGKDTQGLKKRTDVLDLHCCAAEAAYTRVLQYGNVFSFEIEGFDFSALEPSWPPEIN